ncbi:unnamed protein product [Mytilus edulis]|uniref:N-acetyltransferase domain-containing protein n=1 Tax=Mytilus edulis TaxID=6550 RepID=A0A8S3SSK6_MYTED|nr:unnamed protein product [Mytilus edulis]
MNFQLDWETLIPKNTNIVTINDIVENCNSIIKNAAECADMLIKTTSNVKKHGCKKYNHCKKYFNSECYTKRKAYRKAKKYHYRVRSVVNHNDLVRKSKEYKNILKKQFCEFQKAFIGKLRGLRTSDPKSYWSLLNKGCEKVVVKRSLRGKGLGKLLMQETEHFARSEGFETMYLSTHDKQDFYQHVGYSFCKPVVSCGIQPSNIPDSFVLEQIGRCNIRWRYKSTKRLNTKSKDNSSETALTRSSGMSPADALSIPPPARAPAPLIPPPPAPSIPPPPPVVPNPPVANTIRNKSNTDSDISKWDPREISWMKKNIT